MIHTPNGFASFRSMIHPTCSIHFSSKWIRLLSSLEVQPNYSVTPLSAKAFSKDFTFSRKRWSSFPGEPGDLILSSTVAPLADGEQVEGVLDVFGSMCLCTSFQGFFYLVFVFWYLCVPWVFRRTCCLSCMVFVRVFDPVLCGMVGFESTKECLTSEGLRLWVKLLHRTVAQVKSPKKKSCEFWDLQVPHANLKFGRKKMFSTKTSTFPTIRHTSFKK